MSQPSQDSADTTNRSFELAQRIAPILHGEEHLAIQAACMQILAFSMAQRSGGDTALFEASFDNFITHLRNLTLYKIRKEQN